MNWVIFLSFQIVMSLCIYCIGFYQGYKLGVLRGAIHLKEMTLELLNETFPTKK